ncbi:hypothetical protein BV511_01580 [Methylorubrum extorquens]|uniref:hypothetical protein n=1 Tax=Methylorubrum extorquens TaxID=408 RepID=UPI0006FAA89D|nr:hypothetical protein [Methylorubrum extorquens]APX83549.1 hypothetical protein BV511_01580 [Methylorubrum extorquens]KQQ11571.1 hypothetical protein ASF59_01225 [Methylobacterium sp. Leaf121]
MAENVSDHAADRALADLVDAFGHYSDAEMQAFLAATPFAAEMQCGVSPAKPAGPEWLAAAGFAAGEVAIQAARA